MKQQTIQVYHNSGEASASWQVALHDGVSVVAIYRQFREPLQAIRYALDTVAAALELPVVWPEWVKVVVS